ncbi:MAG: bifunctional 5,10-methylenetetrahydrofolate dehydrogenase/5,10-methenyltetrahydrofolate cyclohydrolase [Bryobacteraceae bacterium]
MADILAGSPVRDAILTELKQRIHKLRRPPGLAVILAGDDPASAIYVRHKIKACEELGILSEASTPPASISTGELLTLVDGFNRCDDIDGILVQMPLPRQIDSRRILMAIAPEKDVDAFHPLNVGNLVAQREGPRPCTPAGIMRMFEYYGIPVAGKHAVVVGRSDIVGKPMALLLLHAHATVTICHSKTPDLPEVCRRADILVAAIGRAALVTKDYIQPGATVVDVGMNRLDRREDVARVFRGSEAKLAQFEKNGNVLAGDVHPLDVAEVAGAYTPVPGGVGPLTIAMLMANTVRSAELRLC